MTWFEWLGLAGLVVGGTAAICGAVALAVILIDGLWDSWSLWRTRRALSRRQDLGAPPGA